MASPQGQTSTGTVRRSKGGDKGQKGSKSPFGPVPVSKDSKAHYTPFLVIRYATGDVGSRPLPSGAVFWESPDIWVESSLGVNQPVPGEPNRVFARVSNYGLQQANGVVVKFYWANPSVAISASSANPIGIGFADIPGGQCRVVACPQPWVPIVENGGHECLIAEAYVPADDPLTQPFDPVDDRHVGQKNEQLVIAEPGQPFHVRLDTPNISPLPGSVKVEVHALLSDIVPSLIAARLPAGVTVGPPRIAQIPLSLDLLSTSVYVPPSATFAHRLISVDLATGGGGVSSLPQISKVFEFEAWESRVMEVGGTVPPGASVGQTYLFRIVQSVGPVVLGGYTIGVLVARPGTPQALGRL